MKRLIGQRFLGLLGLAVTLLASAVQADSIATIQLQNRPAEEVIPIVEPMLGAGDAISGQGFRIFLRSSPETLARVRHMIGVLDTPARILQVSVFQGNERDLGELGFSANFQIESGDANVDVGRGGGNEDSEGGGTTYGTAGESVSIDGISTQKGLRDNPVHHVRVIEGTEAYIETGEQIPYFYSAGWIGRKGFAGAIEYKDAITGFYVLPRIRGDNVMLEVNPFRNARSKAGGDNIETQSAKTTINGRVGEWLLIGGVTEQVDRSRSTNGTTIATQSRDNTSIWIRADLVQ